MTGPGVDLLLAERRPSRAATLGWTASAAAVALVLSGLAALAMAIAPSGEALGENDAPLPLLLTQPSEALAAISEPAPEAPATPATPEVETEAEDAPEAPVAEADPVTRPDIARTPEIPSDTAPVAAMAVPKPVKKPEPKPEPAKEKPKEKKAAEKPRAKKAEPSEESAAAAAPAPKKEVTASAGSGKKAVADYGASVMKKIRKTRKKAAPAKGLVIVGFTVAGDGGLAAVQVLQSSGNAALDTVAMDHIRRAAPFPTPPEGAKRSFAFEFVGK